VKNSSSGHRDSVSAPQCTACFKNLGVEAKYTIYGYLQTEGRANVKTLAKMLKLSQPTVTHHLQQMQQSGLLNRSKVGKEAFYSISETCPVINAPCVMKNITVSNFKEK